MPQLPPPDPNESFAQTPAGTPLAAPVVFYVSGQPTERTTRIASAILDLRPGALVVFHA
jgi:hypothetical protein